MKEVVINIDALVRYQIVINTTGDPDAAAAEISRVMRGLLDGVEALAIEEERPGQGIHGPARKDTAGKGESSSCNSETSRDLKSLITSQLVNTLNAMKTGINLTEEQQVVNDIKTVVKELNRLVVLAKDKHDLQVFVGETGEARVDDEYHPFRLRVSRTTCY